MKRPTVQDLKDKDTEIERARRDRDFAERLKQEAMRESNFAIQTAAKKVAEIREIQIRQEIEWRAEREAFLTALEIAWGLIANVSGGNWKEQDPEWVSATEKWRDTQFHPILARIADGGKK